MKGLRWVLNAAMGMIVVGTAMSVGTMFAVAAKAIGWSEFAQGCAFAIVASWFWPLVGKLAERASDE